MPKFISQLDNMMTFALLFKRSSLAAGSIFSLTLLMVMPCHADKEAKSGDFKMTPEMTKMLYQNCYSCHDEFEQEGDIRLDNLETLPLNARLDLMNKMQEKIHLKEMPPKDETEQPTQAERTGMFSWLSAELKKHNASKLEDKLRKPRYGNYVEHDQLFSGENLHLKPFTPDRRWLISEFIFNAKFNRILKHSPYKKIDGKRHNVIGDNNRRANLTNPFLLPSNSGVRYYANTTLDGGHLLTMLTNAKNAVNYMTSELTRRDRRYLPAFDAIMEQENNHNKTLVSREKFLKKSIERVLVDTYKNKHAALMPKFKSVIKGRKTVLPPDPKKTGYDYAHPGRDQLVIMYRSVREHQKTSKTDEELFDKCEREWFNSGHSPRKILSRVQFLRGYIVELRGRMEKHRFDKSYNIYKALPESEMKIITDTILKYRGKGDNYKVIIDKCMAHWTSEFKKQRVLAGLPADGQINSLVNEVFVKIHERKPTSAESDEYGTLAKDYMKSLGRLRGIKKLMQTLILHSDFVYRKEFGSGEPDEHGRRMLSPRDASYALAYAITDSSPDKELVAAVKNGKLNTREDYKREVTRMLKKRDQFYVIDEAVQRLKAASITTTPIRKLRFFREFFGYQNMLPIFKDNKRFGGNYDNAKGRLVSEADRLVDHIIREDKEVFETLLNTEDFYVYHSGDNEAMSDSSKRISKIYHYFKDKDWKNFKSEDLIEHKAFLAEVKMRDVDLKQLNTKRVERSLKSFKRGMTSFTMRLEKGQTAAAPYNSFPSHGAGNAQSRTGAYLGSVEVAKFFNVPLEDWDYPAVQPAKMVGRKGMLTHPAWLIAYAQNTETDPIHRGKWIREKLLAGTIPDIPITVEAAIPEDHHNTLRTRLVKITEKKYCWKCHIHMNPLGYPFEMYDDFGRLREKESLEHPDNLIKKNPDKGDAHIDLRDIYKTLPVDSAGGLSGTGDKNLDGKVDSAIELADRLSRSSHVRQSIIRHAFRYFMGRNEFLSDSKTLIDADKAYMESGGSFDAVIISLLTSDSFIYRKSN